MVRVDALRSAEAPVLLETFEGHVQNITTVRID
jgi:hypothetical protein